MKIKVYSTPSCPYCVTLKAFLKEKGFEFKDIDVSENQAALEEMIQRSNQYGVPVVEINGEIVIGFDREKIMKLLDIKE